MADSLDDLEIRTGHLDVMEVWKSKDEFVEMERKSLERWEGIEEARKEAILNVVERVLERLRDNLEVWVPSSLDTSNGKYMDVTFRVLFSDIDEEIAAQEEITQRRIDRAAEATVQMVADLDTDGT